MSKIHLVLISVTMIILQGCTAVAGVAIIGGASMVNDDRTLGKQIDDQSIEFIAQQRLSEQEGLNDTNLSTISINGSVLMIGQVPTEELRTLAVKTVENIEGVMQVHNQIRIAHITSIATQSKDTWLTAKIKSKLFSHDVLDATNIKVITENNEVFLMGLVAKKDADIAIDIVRNIKGVSRVFNVFEYI